MAAQKVILDTDPGVDDAMAILFALRSPELEVVGLTTVFGNTDINHATRNALRLVEVENHGDIPVAQGAGQPLVISYSPGNTFHGMDGFGNADLPSPHGKPLNIPAALFIVKQIMEHPGEITLAPLGPLTNLALALRLEPRIARLVKEVVVMGGAAYVPGNITPAAEANIYHDPHAASIVFGADWPLTMVGLDVTTKCVMDKKYLEELTVVNHPVNQLIAKILPVYQQAHIQYAEMDGSINTHDPSVTAYLINPGLFKTKKTSVFVETEGRCMGKTVPDPRNLWTHGPSINLCMEVDEPGLLKLYRERMF